MASTWCIRRSGTWPGPTASAWATEGWRSPLGYATIAILVFYVLDRLILKIYPRFFQRGFHTHSKMDATVRSFIARRNINLPVFLLGVLFGLGREAFFLISAWQFATAAYHGIRTFWILVVQKAHRNPQARCQVAARQAAANLNAGHHELRESA